MRRIVVSALLLVLPGCRSAERSRPPADAQSAALDVRRGDVRLAPDVLVRRIAPDVWMHVTLHEYPGPLHYPSNGLLVVTGDSALLVDTAWDDRQTALLLDWAERGLRCPVRRAVATHAHEDRTGGIATLRARGIPMAALARTGELARAAGRPAPDSVPGLALAPRRDAAGIELFYPGAGHAPDNVVVYLPREHVLFGGCLVKPDTATTMGNVADADVANWPAAVARVRERYSAARVVVPGHGAVGGVAALTATERLVREKGAPRRSP